MIKEATATGSTVEEAREAAILLLGARDDDNVEFEIIDLPQKKSFGLFGGSLAKVRAFIEIPDEVKPKIIEKKEVVLKKEQPIAAKPQKPVEPIKKKEQKVEVTTTSTVNYNTDEAEKYLIDILTRLGVNHIKINKKATEGGVELDVEGDGLGVVIGRRGDTLEALQHLVSLVANKSDSEYCRITLNPGNYREKREGTLQAIARRSAIQAIKTGRNVVLEPMNSYERRIIHTAVQNVNGASSWSIGENENRRVCIGNQKSDAQKGFARKGFENRTPRKENNNPVAAPVAQREPKKDIDKTPLYGRIDK